MFEREFITEEDIEHMKTIISRIGENTTVIIEGETISTTTHDLEELE